MGSVVVALRLSCFTACEILPEQRLNPCPLYWMADSYMLYHQGSLLPSFVALCQGWEHLLG